MHRSRLSTLLIDVPRGQEASAAAFWSAALGVPANPVAGEEQFISLPGAFPGLVTAIQAVDDEPRYHLDIETDDVAAETARLVALGAVQLRRWLGCRTLRAPGGHLLCVIPPHSNPGSLRASGISPDLGWRDWGLEGVAEVAGAGVGGGDGLPSGLNPVSPVAARSLKRIS